MKANELVVAIKRWLALDRLFPLVIILGAGIAIVVSWFIRFLTPAEQIIVALLGILAIDAMKERLGILSRISEMLASLSSGQGILRRRSEIIPVEVQAATASQISVIGISCISLIPPHRELLSDKLAKGCTIRFVLLNPNAQVSLQLLKTIRNWEYEKDINAMTSQLEQLARSAKTPKNLEWRLSDVYTPFSMFAVDLEKESGSMVVEYLSVDTEWTNRPHVHLTKKENPEWFDFYARQFKIIWAQSRQTGLTTDPTQ